MSGNMHAIDHSHEKITKSRLKQVAHAVEFALWLQKAPEVSASVDSAFDVLNDHWHNLVVSCYWLTEDEVENIHFDPEKFLEYYKSRTALWLQVKDGQDGN